ncbi:lysozyme inhibitor LprI family protein [Donghicola mangrovi]|nr:lysozyme inhibitor LprI family protein [Donghicola mangrovi]
MKRLILMAALVAGPALAQDDMVFDDSIVGRCVQAAADAGAAEACIGKAADDCMTRNPGGESTYGMNFCIGQEAAVWDGLLNAEYQRVMASDKEIDAQTKADGYGAPELAPALKAMQRAWIAYRDTTCTYEASQWGGGTGAGPAYAGCMMRLTAMQTLYLRDTGPL